MDHAEPHEPDPHAADRRVAVEAEIGQRLADLPVGLPVTHDRQPGVRRVHLHHVEVVLRRVGAGGHQPPVVELGLELEGLRNEEARGLDEPPQAAVEGQLRQTHVDAVDGDVGRPEPIGHRCNDLQCGPAAGVARQLEAVPPEIEDLLGSTRDQDRHAGVIECHFASAGQRRRLRLRVVADRGQDPAVASHPVQVGMPEDVAGAVHARCLAVPHPDHAVVPRQWSEVVLLAAPDRRGGEVLIHPGYPAHVVVVQAAAGARQGLIEPAERGTRVAAHERPDPKATPAVGSHLVEQHPHQRLHTGEQDLAVG